MSNLERLYVHHDLIVELGRVEMAIESLERRDAANQPDAVDTLEQRRARLCAALDRLSV